MAAGETEATSPNTKNNMSNGNIDDTHDRIVELSSTAMLVVGTLSRLPVLAPSHATYVSCRGHRKNIGTRTGSISRRLKPGKIAVYIGKNRRIRMPLLTRGFGLRPRPSEGPPPSILILILRNSDISALDLEVTILFMTNINHQRYFQPIGIAPR